MIMVYISFYIIFTIFLQEIVDTKTFKQQSTYCDCKENAGQVKSSKSVKNTSNSGKTTKSLIHASKTYENPDKCNVSLVSPKMIINPYKQLIQNSVQQKPFNSFYLKCAACLAVAEEISQTIKRILEKAETPNKKQEFVNDQLSETIHNLCQNGFKNFDLRKFKEITLITNKLKCTNHINSQMDGSWTKILRDLCHLYTVHMDMKHISNNYKNNINKLSADICSGSGIFRDCQNLDSGDFLKNIKNIQLCDVCRCRK